jgi:ABC-type Na+ efflux pump permease subunit
LTLPGWFAVLLIVCVSLLIFCGITPNDPLSERTNDWARSLGTGVGCIMLLWIAVLGAASVCGERDRQTLDCLLTTGLSSQEILWGKWWGCMFGMKPLWILLGVIWLVGLVIGGIHVAILPFLVAATLIYAGGTAWIGIYCSIVMESSVRAAVSAIIATVFAGGAYIFVVGAFLMIPMILLDSPDPINQFQMFWQFLIGFSPAVVMAWLPMSELNAHEINWFDRDISFVPCAAVGLTFWIALWYFLPREVLRRFQLLANRAGKPQKPAH